MRLMLYTNRRAGSHFLANWIISNILGETYFKRGAPSTSGGWFHVHGMCGLNQFARRHKIDPRGMTLDQLPEHVFVTMEDAPISYARPADWMRPARGAVTGCSNARPPIPPHNLLQRYQDDATKLILLRDPINVMASTIANNGAFTSIERCARVFMDYAHVIASGQAEEKQYTVVRYEELATSREYRDTLATNLGFTNQDIAVEAVPHHGGGSSFDGLAMDGNASAMDTNERWKTFLDNPTYLWSLGFPGFLEAREALYGPLPTPLAERVGTTR